MRIGVAVVLVVFVLPGVVRASAEFGSEVIVTRVRARPTEDPLTQRGCVVFQRLPRPGYESVAFLRACRVGRVVDEQARLEVGIHDPETRRLFTVRTETMIARPEWLKPDDQLELEWVDEGSVLIVGARRFDPAPRLGQLYVRRRAFRGDYLKPLLKLPLPFDVVEVGRTTVTVAIFGAHGPGLAEARTWPLLEAALSYGFRSGPDGPVQLVPLTTHPDWARVVVRRKPPHAIVQVTPESGM